MAKPDKALTIASTTTVILLLSWGVYALTYVTPNGEGSIVDEILKNQNSSAGMVAPKALPPNSQTRATLYIRDCRYVSPSDGGGTFNDPDGLFVAKLSCQPPDPPQASLLAASTHYYGVFTHAQYGGGSLQVWYTGPNGNLTPLGHRNYQAFSIQVQLGCCGLDVLETPVPGNYSIHILNAGTLGTNMNVTVSTGVSSVVYSKPYVTPGLVLLGLTVAPPIATIYILMRRTRPSKVTMAHKATAAA